MWIERKLEDVRNSSFNILLEKGEKREIEPCPLRIEFLLILGNSSVIDQCMVVEEQSACNVEGDKHVDAVVFVSSQDEEYTKAVTQPGECVQEIHSPTSVFRDEEV